MWLEVSGYLNMKYIRRANSYIWRKNNLANALSPPADMRCRNFCWHVDYWEISIAKISSSFFLCLISMTSLIFDGQLKSTKGSWLAARESEVFLQHKQANTMRTEVLQSGQPPFLTHIWIIKSKLAITASLHVSKPDLVGEMVQTGGVRPRIGRCCNTACVISHWWLLHHTIVDQEEHLQDVQQLPWRWRQAEASIHHWRMHNWNNIPQDFYRKLQEMGEKSSR